MKQMTLPLTTNNGCFQEPDHRHCSHILHELFLQYLNFYSKHAWHLKSENKI